MKRIYQIVLYSFFIFLSDSASAQIKEDPLSIVDFHIHTSFKNYYRFV